MKLRTLIFLVFSACLGSTAANASTFTYVVDFTLSGVAVTGNIVTTCDSCVLNNSAASSYFFNVAGSPPSSISGTSANLVFSGDELDVTPANIVDNISSNSENFFNAGAGGGELIFGNGVVQLDPPSGGGSVPPETYASRFVVATNPLVATPLPAALPLFATGLGAMGLLGWRRKRKAQAVAA